MSGTGLSFILLYMSESESFQGRLEAAVEAKRQFLEQKGLPQLKESFRIFKSLFENLYGVLLHKSFVHEDPYKYEQKISEVILPPQGAVLESEKVEKLSQRLSEFHSQLDFLDNYYQFSLEFLNLDRLKRIIALIQYINWLHVAETSPDATTALLAETLSKVRLSGDRVSTSMVTSSLDQMLSQSRAILALLKQLISFKRQTYKLELRRKLLTPIRTALAESYTESPENAYELLKSAFIREMKGQPFYRDLVMEILNEEFAENASELQERAVDSLKIPEQLNERKRTKPDFRQILLEAIRLMLPAGGYLNDALKKVTANQEMLEKGRRGFGDKLRAWLKRAFKSRESRLTIEIRYFDNRTSSTQSEVIEFNGFVERVRRKAVLFAGLVSPESGSHNRLNQASEEQLHLFLKKNLGELQLMHRRMEGLNEYFRHEASGEERKRIKGVRIELSGVKNCVVRANRKRYDYVALKEEEEQLKKMGVVDQ